MTWDSKVTAHQFHVVPIGTIDGDCQWNSLTISKQAALGSQFGAVCGVGAGCFFPPMVLWSSHHP